MKSFKLNLFLVGVLWTSCHCSVSESQAVVVSVEVDSDATLPCHIDQPGGDLNRVAVEWTCRPAANPNDKQQVHLFKDGRDVFNYAHRSYQARAALSHQQLSHGDLSLKLLRVRFSDEGTFLCYDPHRRVTREVRLQVGSWSQPVISSNGPLVTCDSGCWFPQPELSWLNGDGTNVSAGSSVTYRSSLHCYEVQSNVTMKQPGHVTCRVHLTLFNLTAETQHVISESDFPKTIPVIAPTATIAAIAVIFSTAMSIMSTTAVFCYCHYRKKQLEYTQQQQQQQETLERLKEQLKAKLKTRFGCLCEWIADRRGLTTALGEVFTEPCVTVAGGGENIQRPDIFKDGQRPLRTVLTKGVAGIGKTVLAQKYILEWAENLFDDVPFVFPFTFRDKHLENKNYSMLELVNFFVGGGVAINEAAVRSPNAVFILDGLDHFVAGFSLDFRKKQKWTHVTERTSAGRLLANLMLGELLPSARVWIITRPAASNKIPSKCRIDRVLEVTGFTDTQKDAFFEKTFKDQGLVLKVAAGFPAAGNENGRARASEIPRDDENETHETSLTSYIKASKCLYFMCHMPVFCWTVAKVLRDSIENHYAPPKNQRTMATREEVALPQTTAMYIHFMVVQSQHKPKRFKHHARSLAPPQAPDQAVLALGKLAFERMRNPGPIRETDLAAFVIDRDAVGYSMLKEESSGSFCFIHRSIQGFLAALYVFVLFVRDGADLLSETQAPSASSDMGHFLQRAVDKALQRPNEHGDDGCFWFLLRFLLGLSLEANQRLLQHRLLPIQPGSGSSSHQADDPGPNEETNGNISDSHSRAEEGDSLLGMSRENVRYKPGRVREYIKTKIREDENLSAGERINLLHCLNEMNDPSLVEEVRRCLNSGHQLSTAERTELEFMLLSRPRNIVTSDETAEPNVNFSSRHQ